MSLQRRCQRIKENAALATLVKDVSFCKSYIKSLDKLLEVIGKAHPEWMAEAFPEPPAEPVAPVEPTNAV